MEIKNNISTMMKTMNDYGTERKKLIEEFNDKYINNKDEDDDSKCTSANELALREFDRKQKAKKIAAKVARGEYVSESEMKYIKEKNPELLEKSNYINEERKRIEARIRNAKTIDEAKRILRNAGSVGIGISLSGLKTGDISGAEAVGYAISKAVDKAGADTQSDVESIKRKEQKKRLDKRV